MEITLHDRLYLAINEALRVSAGVVPYGWQETKSLCCSRATLWTLRNRLRKGKIRESQMQARLNAVLQLTQRWA